MIYKEDSQVYGSGSKEVALATAPPAGVPIEDKRILFITFRPDTGELVAHELAQDEVMNAELIEKKTRSAKEENNP